MELLDAKICNAPVWDIKHFMRVINSVASSGWWHILNVAFWLLWRPDAGQRQIKVETTLCVSTLEFTTSKNALYFNVDMNNIRQRQNNAVFFNVEFHNVGQRRNNVVKMAISKNEQQKSFQIEYT